MSHAHVSGTKHTQGSFASTYSRPFIYLRSTRCGSCNKPTNAEQIRVARGDSTHAPQMLLYPVPPRCFCEECLKDVYLEPVRASTTGEIEIKRTYTAMAMTASVSNTAYQKRRLRGMRIGGLIGMRASSISTTHFRVDFTIEKPRFSRV
jgi:hypothetical protein